MALRPCIDCGTLTPNTRCPIHTRARSRARDQQRGSRQQRGLDNTYDRNRSILMANATVCAICHRPPTATDPLTADHIVRREHGGGNDLANLRAVHASWNYSQGRACR